MIHINQMNELYLFCKALASPIRIQIISLLSNSKQMSMNELSDNLGITSGALTPHIKYLENANVILIQNENGKHGVQKKCSLRETKYLLSFINDNNEDMFETELPIGSYSKFCVSAPCGLATPTNMIGRADDSRYFDDPSRIYADVIWSNRGALEYHIPNYIKRSQKLTKLKISQEINCEIAHAQAKAMSEIVFSINNIVLGSFKTPELQESQKSTAPVQIGNGSFMPCGFLKEVLITDEGTFLNGELLNNVKISDLDVNEETTIKYQISVAETSPNGFAIYGKNFGNYRQGILVAMEFSKR